MEEPISSDNRYGRIGFLQLISRISELWAARRGELLKQASEYVDTITLIPERELVRQTRL